MSLNKFLSLCISCVTLSSFAADWPAYRGPLGDGVSPEKIPGGWPETGLKRLWTAPAQTGFSSFTIADGRAFTLVRRDIEGNGHEICVAMDADSGKELWTAKLSLAKYDGGGDSGGGGDGPRSTPIFDSGKVYVFDAQLGLWCLDAKTGKEVWRRDLLKDNAGKKFTWQNSASPVIDGNILFAAGGGAGQALLGINKKTGEVIWKGQDDGATHSTPVLAKIGGVRQVIFFTRTGLVSVAPKTGDVLWRYKFPFKTSTGISPVVAGDLVYCSAGYGVGAAVVRVSRKNGAFEATEVWRKPNELLSHWSTPVVKDGYLYGLFGHAQYGKAPLKCVELLTGKEMWSESGFGPGGLVLTGNRLLVLGDKGQLVLVETEPSAYKEVSRMQTVAGKCWSTPSISHGRIFLRSTTEGACYEIAAAK